LVPLVELKVKANMNVILNAILNVILNAILNVGAKVNVDATVIFLNPLDLTQ
jgi:hypothetical protein